MVSVFDFENVEGIDPMIRSMDLTINDKQLTQLIAKATDDDGVNAVLSRAEEIRDDTSFSQEKRMAAQMLLSTYRVSRRFDRQLAQPRGSAFFKKT